MINNNYLQLIPDQQDIIIDACRGGETLAGAHDVFKHHINKEFKTWGTNKPSNATMKISVRGYEMIQDASFEEMLNSLSEVSVDWDKLCLTQAQIKKFCKENPTWLRQGGFATFFLFKTEGQYFVSYVRIMAKGLAIGVERPGLPGDWDAQYKIRLFVPKIIL